MLRDLLALRWFTWGRLALFLWAVVLLVVCGRALAEPRKRSLYPTYAAAGADWRAGANLYLRTRERPEPHIDLFRYSPFVASLLVPWSYLPEGVGGALWRLLATGVFLGGAFWWVRRALPVRLTARSQGLLFVLLLPLALPSLGNGQANLFMVGFILAAMACAAEQRWLLTALFLALATALKLYPLVFGLLLLVCYPRRLGLPLLLGLLAVAGLPFLVQNPEYVWGQYASWVRTLCEDEGRRDWPAALSYRDLYQLYRLWGLPLSVRAYELLQVLLGGACAVLCLASGLRGLPPRRTLAMVLTLGTGWQMLCGPSVESSTFVLMGPALAWTLVDPKTPGVVRWSAWGSATLLLGCLLAGLGPRAAQIHALGLHPLASLLFFATALARSAVEVRGRPDPVTPGVCRTARAA